MWKKERAMGSILKMLASIARNIGESFVVRDLPERVFVPITGRTLARSSIKRYVDYVVEWCRERDVEDCPVVREYVRRGSVKVLRVRVDIEKCEALARNLFGVVELARWKRKSLEDELRKCHGKNAELARKLANARRRAEALEREVRRLRARLRLLDVGRSLGSRVLELLLRPEEAYRCIKERRADGVCREVIRVLDVITEPVLKFEGDDYGLVNVFIELYNRDPEFEKFVEQVRRSRK